MRKEAKKKTIYKGRAIWYNDLALLWRSTQVAEGAGLENR